MKSNPRASLTDLQEANSLLRCGNYIAAIRKYALLFFREPDLDKSVEFNLDLARRRYREQLGLQSRKTVAVCSWELAHNSVGRAYTLAELYGRIAEINLIGCIFTRFGSDLWEPIRDVAIPIRSIKAQDGVDFFGQALEFVLEKPYDIVHLSKPRFPNIVLGILYKWIWGAQVFLDIDDEELAFVDSPEGFDVDRFLSTNTAFPKGESLIGGLATRLAIDFRNVFDWITVSNGALQQRYGGDIVPHVRDERRFSPSEQLRLAARKRFSVQEDARVVLFFGTPRAHKGLLETARAISSVRDDKFVFVIAGEFPDASLKTSLLSISGVDYRFLGNQSVLSAHEIVALGDYCILIQDLEREVSKFQIPAKITDALAMGVTVLALESAAIKPLIEAGVVIGVSQERIPALLEKGITVPKERLVDYFLQHLAMEKFQTLFTNRIQLPNNAPFHSSTLRLHIDFILASVRTNIHQGTVHNLDWATTGNATSSTNAQQGVADLQVIKGSGLFHQKWYLEKYGNRIPENVDPVVHYLSEGASLGFDPSPGFSTTRYLNTYKSVAKVGFNPLLHYIKYGKVKGYRCYGSTQLHTVTSGKDKRVDESLPEPSGSGIDRRLAADIKLVEESGFFDKQWYQERNFERLTGWHCPISHYLTVGCTEGLDPSPFFSTKYYLNRYKSVASANINPLVHYVRYGRQKGYAIQPVLGAKKGLAERVSTDIYIACWLRNKESVHDGLIRLAECLSSQGLAVTFVTHSKEILSRENLRSMAVSFDLLGDDGYDDVPSIPVSATCMNELLSTLDVRISSSKKQSKYCERDALINRIRLAYSFWFAEFKSNRPAWVLVWGSTCALSKLHIEICRELRIEYLVLERGHFPTTISVDSQGQFAYGGSMLLPHRRDIDLDRYSKIVNWVRNCDEVPYAARNGDIGELDRINQAKSEGKRIILFIGVNDLGCGIAYSQPAIHERHSLHYHSTSEALENVVRALEMVSQEYILVVKPHPIDLADYSKVLGDNVFIESAGNINQLISISDVCVTMSTTSIARCLVEERPLVLLSLTDVSGRDIAYESQDPSDLVSTIRAALEEIDFGTKKKNAKKYLLNLFDTRLFSTEHGSDLMLTVGDLGRSLAARASLFARLRDPGSIIKVQNNLLPECQYQAIELDGRFSVPTAFRLHCDIVLPIYGDANLTAIVIDAALAAIGDEDVRLVVINDCSPDVQIERLCDVLEQSGDRRIVVLRNQVNLGFSATVNRGIEYCVGRDVILLNSDAVIPKQFLHRIRSAAYCHPKIASVTPFSNNASIFSLPFPGGSSLDTDRAIDFVDSRNRLIPEKYLGMVREVPVGHAFCIYLRRSALSWLGRFDELVFGRGYSEEVDYCLRARIHGFINVAMPGLFVGHVGGVSFGDDSNYLRDRNRKIISERYPGYDEELRVFGVVDPFSNYREEMGCLPQCSEEKQSSSDASKLFLS